MAVVVIAMCLQLPMPSKRRSGAGAANPDVCYIEQINRWRTAVKKRLLHGFGIALMLASPMWITIGNPPDYMNFGISFALGILLMILASKTSPDA